jgi:hypothetical protein
VDRTALFGADYRGRSWRRSKDKVGAAFVINGISGDHRRYVALGGPGFVLGDGALTYGTERILEGYYTLHLWRGVSLAFDVRQVGKPGYNQDRGSVLEPGFRIHIEDSLNAWRCFTMLERRPVLLSAGQFAARGTTPGYRGRRYGTCARKNRPYASGVHWPGREGKPAEPRL